MKHKKHLKKAVGSIRIVLKIPVAVFLRIRRHARELEARSHGLPPETSSDELIRFFKNKH